MENKKTGYPHIDKPWMKFYPNYKQKEYPKINLTEYIKLRNKGRENLIANTYYGKETTYKEMFEQIDNASRVLTQLGVNVGERILFLLPNIPEAGYLWLGAAQIGAVADFVDPRPDSMDLNANAQKLLEIIKYEGIKHIFALDRCYLGTLRPIENELLKLGINRIVVLSIFDSMDANGLFSYFSDVAYYGKSEASVSTKIKELMSGKAMLEKAIGASSVEILRYPDLVKKYRDAQFTSYYKENTVIYIGHTSGTSGARPKPITLTNENKISNMEQLADSEVAYIAGARVLHILPFFAPFGADDNYLIILSSGQNSIDIPEFSISDLGYLIEKYHPDLMVCAPAWLSALPEYKGLSKEAVAGIKEIHCGGDSITREDEEKLWKWLQAAGSKGVIKKGYGMSEFCGCASFSQKDYSDYESIGIPLTDTVFAIVNPEIDDKLVPLRFEEGMEYLEGELAVSSPSVTPGTLGDKIIVPHFELDGKSYIRTRDIARMDRNGIFKFASRKDRSFTRFDGYKVKPYEIESVLSQNPAVKYCAITPYYDVERLGFMPAAHIVLEKEYMDSEQKKIVEDIISGQFINNTEMSSRQIPSKFIFKQSLPLTKNSKVNYNLLSNEPFNGKEIDVKVTETNLSVGEIKIY